MSYRALDIKTFSKLSKQTPKHPILKSVKCLAGVHLVLHSALPGCAECWAQSQLRLSCDQTSAEARDIRCEVTSGLYQGASSMVRVQMPGM